MGGGDGRHLVGAGLVFGEGCQCCAVGEARHPDVKDLALGLHTATQLARKSANRSPFALIDEFLWFWSSEKSLV